MPPIVKRHQIHGAGMQAAKQALAQELAKWGVELREGALNLATRAALQAYVSNPEPKNYDRIVQGTHALMRMKPGDSRIMEATSAQIIRSRMQTAREHMGAPQARWTVTEIGPGLFRVKRREDGTPPPYDVARNPLVALLVRLQPGEEVPAPMMKAVDRLNPHVRQMARRAMGTAKPNWKARTTPAGILVRRTA